MFENMLDVPQVQSLARFSEAQKNIRPGLEMSSWRYIRRDLISFMFIFCALLGGIFNNVVKSNPDKFNEIRL